MGDRRVGRGGWDAWSRIETENVRIRGVEYHFLIAWVHCRFFQKVE